MFIVEIIRYGNPDLGVHPFENFDDIQPTMDEYNRFRGGKYPSYYVIETFDPIHVEGPHKRIYYKKKQFFCKPA